MVPPKAQGNDISPRNIWCIVLDFAKILYESSQAGKKKVGMGTNFGSLRLSAQIHYTTPLNQAQSIWQH